MFLTNIVAASNLQIHYTDLPVRKGIRKGTKSYNGDPWQLYFAIDLSLYKLVPWKV